MKRAAWMPALLAVALYLPTVRYAFVQDDRGIILANPAAHSVAAAIHAFDDPYWPVESGGGLYRPLTIVTYALDWSVSGGRPGWFHVMNAVWHGLATLLVGLLLARWLPPVGVAAAAFVFATHPLHVEGVANLVARSQLLAACGMFAALLAARRRWWLASLGLAAAAMFAKEHGVVIGALILLDDWLEDGPRYPKWFYAALGAVTVGYLFLWLQIGSQGGGDVAPPFIGAGRAGVLALSLPAVLRAASLLVWPLDLSSDYSPQVIAFRTGVTFAAVLGAVVVIAAPAAVIFCRRRAPVIAFATGVAALTYLPTSNLLFPSGVVLAERSLYEAVILAAAAVGLGAAAIARHRDVRRASLVVGLILVALTARTLLRMPAWADNRSYLITLLTEHPESYRGHFSAAAVSAGLGDQAGARRQYALADSLFAGDPYMEGNRAFYLLSIGDSTMADSLARVARRIEPRERMALRVQVLLGLARGLPGARALADSAMAWHGAERSWYDVAAPGLKR